MITKKLYRTQDACSYGWGELRVGYLAWKVRGSGSPSKSQRDRKSCPLLPQGRAGTSSVPLSPNSPAHLLLERVDILSLKVHKQELGDP